MYALDWLLPDNTFTNDISLIGYLKERLGNAFIDWEDELNKVGKSAANELARLAYQAEQNLPIHVPYTPWGEYCEEIVYCSAWEEIKKFGVKHGLASLPYESHPASSYERRLVQAALIYLFAPSSAIYTCPIAMTDGAIRVILDSGEASLHKDILARLISRDPSYAWTAGQWMTEQQGGSDVGLNSVSARLLNARWVLNGRKYFCSNTTAEVALVLARPDGAPPGTKGLALFLVPRKRDDGTPNWRINRLKDKLGTRAMATAEVDLINSEAILIGPITAGFKLMTKMLNITRIHNAINAAALMQRAYDISLSYSTHRVAFGKTLMQHPLHDTVLRRMKAETEAAKALTFRAVELLGKTEAKIEDDQERLLLRVATPLVKLFTAKQAVQVISEAIEAIGGAGYIEDTGIPSLLRNAQVLPIWEGTTNILSLDLLRALTKDEAAQPLRSEITQLSQFLPDSLSIGPYKMKLGYFVTYVSNLINHMSFSANNESYMRDIAYALAGLWATGIMAQLLHKAQGKYFDYLESAFMTWCKECLPVYISRLDL
jgi:alkylation response protein AidB-like acyl-CoA dehydrogenase